MTSNDKIASWSLDLKTKRELSIEPEDSENLSDLIRGIDSVQVAVFFRLRFCCVAFCFLVGLVAVISA